MNHKFYLEGYSITEHAKLNRSCDILSSSKSHCLVQFVLSSTAYGISSGESSVLYKPSWEIMSLVHHALGTVSHQRWKVPGISRKFSSYCIFIYRMLLLDCIVLRNFLLETANIFMECSIFVPTDAEVYRVHWHQGTMHGMLLDYVWNFSYLYGSCRWCTPHSLWKIVEADKAKMCWSSMVALGK